MKKLILMMFLIAGTAFGVQAQKHKKGDAKLPKALTAKLNLTADQKTKVDAVMLSKAKSIDSLTIAAKGDAKAIRKGKKQINTQTELQVDKILTADQKKTYADFKAAKQAKNKAKASLNNKDAGTPPTKQ